MIRYILIIIGLLLSGCQHTYVVNANKNRAHAYQKNILIEIVDNTKENKEEIEKVIDFAVKKLYFDDKSLFTGIDSNIVPWSTEQVKEWCSVYSVRSVYYSCIQNNSDRRKRCYRGTDTKIKKIENSKFLVNYKFDIDYTRSCVKKNNKFSLLVYEENDKLLIYIKGKDQQLLRQVIIAALRKYKIERSYMSTYDTSLI